ncbi:MAG: hypothetical protein RLZZ292_1131 [Bacteroidota bacterium]|jgi:imidazolonepropionase-like amidohydrolase
MFKKYNSSFSSFLFFTCCILFFLANTPLLAQPVPASKQTQPIVISGGTAHLGNGQIIENAMVAFENGKLTLVNTLAVGRGFSGYKIINATGKHIYPGFIAPNTSLGLTEIESVRATRDFDEVGDLNPNVRALVAYNTDSEILPTVRGNGTLLAQISPRGGLVSGTSSIVQLDAWNWEDAAFRTDDGVFMEWPSPYSFNGWWAEPGDISRNEQYNKQVKAIERLFNEAQAYARKGNTNTPKNLKLEAMRGLFDGSKTLFVNANLAKSIEEAVLAAKKQGIKMVVVGGNDAYLVTDLLKENNIPVLLGRTQRLPTRDDEAYDQSYKTAISLQKAGVLYSFSCNDAWQQRNLPFQAGQAIGYGLGHEDAVSALTLNTAKILGIDSQVGSLEIGKDATLFISDGDPLDNRTNKVTHAFIQGREISLDNKQRALYKRFQEKYKRM